MVLEEETSGIHQEKNSWVLDVHLLTVQLRMLLDTLFYLYIALLVVGDTPLCFQAHNDRSRDYTIPDTGMLTMPRASGLPTAGASWQANPQAASMYAGNSVGAQAPGPNGQMPTWDPSMRGGAYVVAPSTYPGQTFAPPPVSHYPASAAISSAPAESLQASQPMSQYGLPPNARPPTSASVDQPLYYPS